VFEKTLLNLLPVRQSLDFTCGAACFASMFQYFKGWSPGEMHFAKELKTLETGYTAPEDIVNLARSYGLQCGIKIGARVEDLTESLASGHVVFVTWWYEDAGHYSLVKGLGNEQIVLMDPWLERESADHPMDLTQFVANWSLRGSKMIYVWV